TPSGLNAPSFSPTLSTVPDVAACANAVIVPLAAAGGSTLALGATLAATDADVVGSACFGGGVSPLQLEIPTRSMNTIDVFMSRFYLCRSMCVEWGNWRHPSI